MVRTTRITYSRSRPVITLLAPLFLSIAGVIGTGRPAHAQLSHLPKVYDSEQFIWSLSLGSHQYTVPRIDHGLVFIGTDDKGLEHAAVESTGGGLLSCLEQQTGQLVWQLPIPRNMHGTKAPFHFNHWKCGVCSRPALEGDRLYIVGPRGDLLCLDRQGQANGNAGPFVDELNYMGLSQDSKYELSTQDGDIVWQYDLIEQLGVVPHDVCGSSPAIQGDYLYACTSNGVDHTHLKVANTKAPSLIAVDKLTGKLAAIDSADIGDRILHGQWSSPVAAQFNGQQLILFGGGDGVLYAFRALEGPIGDRVRSLEIAWQYDCNPRDYREHDGEPIPYGRWNKKRPDGPSEVIATPVVHNGRIYVTIGQSPVHGPGLGILSCIDGASGQLVWDSREVGRTLSDVVVHEGLAYVADYSGKLHCFDADTGKRYWHHDLAGGVWCATPLVLGDKIYIANEKNWIWVLRTGREKEVLGKKERTRSIAITPVANAGILLVPTQRRIFALRVAE